MKLTIENKVELTEEEVSALESAVDFWVSEHNSYWPGVSETHDEMVRAINKLKGYE